MRRNVSRETLWNVSRETKKMATYPINLPGNNTCMLCSTNFIPNDGDVFLASSKASFQTFLSGKIKFQANDFSVIKQHSTIRFPANADDLIKAKVDYIAFRNAVFGGDWWYAFITGIYYVNPNVTEIHFEIDVISTFIYDAKMGSQFLERMTVKEDGIGDHLEPEQFTVNQYVYSQWTHPHIANNGGELHKMQTAVLVYGGDYIGYEYDNIPAVGGIFASASAADLTKNLEMFLSSPDVYTVYGAYLLPSIATGRNSGILYSQGISSASVNIAPIQPGYPFPQYFPADQGGWVPNNYKLYTYPYTALYCTNNNGQSMMFSYEAFTGAPSFKVFCNHLPPINPVLVPVDYYNSGQNIDGINPDFIFSLGELPQVGYSQDSYSVWAATKGQTQALQTVGGVIASVALTAASLKVPALKSVASGAISGTVNTVADRMTGSLNAQNSPDSVKFSSTQAGSMFTLGLDKYGPSFAVAQCPQYLAKQYDDFFSMYGYAIYRTMPINFFTNRRPVFDYYKFADLNIDVSIPAEYASKLQQLLENGIRFWYDADKMGDFSEAVLKENSLH